MVFAEQGVTGDDGGLVHGILRVGALLKFYAVDGGVDLVFQDLEL